MRTYIRHLRVRDLTRLEAAKNSGVLMLPVLFREHSTGQARPWSDVWSREGRFWLVCQQTHDQLQTLVPPAQPGETIRARGWIATPGGAGRRDPTGVAGRGRGVSSRDFVEGTCFSMEIVKTGEGTPWQSSRGSCNVGMEADTQGRAFSPGKIDGVPRGQRRQLTWRLGAWARQIHSELRLRARDTRSCLRTPVRAGSNSKPSRFSGTIRL